MVDQGSELSLSGSLRGIELKAAEREVVSPDILEAPSPVLSTTSADAAGWLWRARRAASWRRARDGGMLRGGGRDDASETSALGSGSEFGGFDEEKIDRADNDDWV